MYCENDRLEERSVIIINRTIDEDVVGKGGLTHEDWFPITKSGLRQLYCFSPNVVPTDVRGYYFFISATADLTADDKTLRLVCGALSGYRTRPMVPNPSCLRLVPLVEAFNPTDRPLSPL
jgi:hypothetical protein